MKIMITMEILKIFTMSKITIKALVTGTRDKHINNRPNICKDFSNNKLQKIKNTLYQMEIECLEICMPLYNKEKYIDFYNLVWKFKISYFKTSSFEIDSK